MKVKQLNFPKISILIIIILFFTHAQSTACSTFKLQKGNALIYGHNLNQGDLGVPGMIFINKRGIFKNGRTWSELATKEQKIPSSHSWISRYGSVTFNAFGRDFPDGGMNEAGLYIWEMNEDAEYPKNDSLPKLNQMVWMQYILDNYSTLEEAIQCASEIEIEGWGWHYFVADAQGNCASIAFIDGEVVVNKAENMPVPALFNTPYDRELEFLKYYRGFGGLYEPELNDPEVPRFVKAAVMLRDFNPDQNIVDYGFEMLNNLQVNDVPEWSIIFDVRKNSVYFKTRLNPEIKSFSMDEIDFSNNTPVLILNMDINIGGDVLSQLHPYSNEEIRKFTESLVIPIVPEEFYTNGGLTLDEFLISFSTHSDKAALTDQQFFKGSWVNKEDKSTLTLYTKGDQVTGTISNQKDTYEIEHLSMVGNNIRFTFRTKGNTLIEIQASINGNEMVMNTYGTEDDYGSAPLIKK